MGDGDRGENSLELGSPDACWQPRYTLPGPLSTLGPGSGDATAATAADPFLPSAAGEGDGMQSGDCAADDSAMMQDLYGRLRHSLGLDLVDSGEIAHGDEGDGPGQSKSHGQEDSDRYDFRWFCRLCEVAGNNAFAVHAHSPLGADSRRCEVWRGDTGAGVGADDGVPQPPRSGMAIFAIGSRANHSCDPNAVFALHAPGRPDMAGGVLHMHARRAIAAGEEVRASTVLTSNN